MELSLTCGVLPLISSCACPFDVEKHSRTFWAQYRRLGRSLASQESNPQQTLAERDTVNKPKSRGTSEDQGPHGLSGIKRYIVVTWSRFSTISGRAVCLIPQVFSTVTGNDLPIFIRAHWKIAFLLTLPLDSVQRYEAEGAQARHQKISHSRMRRWRWPPSPPPSPPPPPPEFIWRDMAEFELLVLKSCTFPSHSGTKIHPSAGETTHFIC